MTFEDLWPVARLRIATPLLELRYPCDEDLAAMAALATRGIHDPAFMPFLHPWTDAPADEIGPGMLRYHWRTRAAATPDNWSLPLAVVRDGVVVGCQLARAEAFAIRREVTTASWLGREHQGRGTGTEMRAAVLHFAFAGLGADEACSSAIIGNHASLRVSAKLGYAEDGVSRLSPRGELVVEQRLRLTRERWATGRRNDIDIVGLDACRPWFGLD
ncbi:MAG: hypothetical protein QOF57_1180 [Frankiaceae bacterium]|jgi:RimJ/RimL family protein N-acetyltransferase|nr:hypothetical protein [Frankiaceae bacterium]